MVTILTPTSVLVSWNVEGDLSSEGVQWTVYYRQIQTAQTDRRNVPSNEQSVTVSGSSRSVEIGELQQGAEYVFAVASTATINGSMLIGARVMATGTAGDGEWCSLTWKQL